jgi:hypothetical protein
VQGGTVTVNVGPNDTSVEVSAAGSSNTTTHDVEPNKDATIPVPNVPPGTIVFITVGKGLRARVLAVEVIALSP